MTFFRRIHTLAALLAVASLGAHAATGAPGQEGISANEIVIGSCCVQSGPASELGLQQLSGAEAYLKFINAKGGINGRMITLKKYDDRYEPDGAVEAFNKMKGDNCFAGAFFVGTPTAAKHVPLAEEHKIPIVGLFTGAQLLHEPFRPHVISVRASYFDETASQIDKIWKDLGPQKVAVIYQDDAFGKAVLTGVERALTAHDTKPVATGNFKRNTLDVAQAIGDVKGSNPDVVVIVGPYAPVAEVVKQSHAQGWKPIFTTVSFVGTEAFVRAAGADAEGMVISQVVPPLTREDLPTVLLYKKIMKQYAPQSKQTLLSFEGFVDAMVLCEGLKSAGKDLNREKLIKAIEQIKNKDMGLGSNLKLSYSSTRHKGFDTVYTTVVRKGEPIAFFNWKLIKSKSKG